MYAENLLVELIRKSIALTDKQRAYLVDNFKEISEQRKRGLFDILSDELMKRREINQQRMMLSQKHSRDVKRIDNEYQEDLSRYSETKVLKELDEEMDALFDDF